jgi:hypothetical protein
MTITVVTLDHRPPPGIEPWKYRVTRPDVENHVVDMTNLDPTLELVKHLEEIRVAVVALFPDEPEDLCLAEAFTDVIARLEDEMKTPGVFSDAEHLTDEIDWALNMLYDYCDTYRVVLSHVKADDPENPPPSSDTVAKPES